MLKKDDLIILESTSPVGTTMKISKYLGELRTDLSFPHSEGSPDVNMAYCPERVLPGNIMSELKTNSRVIGGVQEICSIKAKEFYKHLVDGECVVTNCNTAEMVKLVENASRDVQIAFANEVSIICDENEVDVWELRNLANKHPRVNILEPGPGVGGHCIAVDPWFLISGSNNSKLMKSAREVNDYKPIWVLDKIKQEINRLSDIKTDVSICIFGVTFKPNVDDIRESPALKIVKDIYDIDNIKLSVVEPNIDASMLDQDLTLTTLENGLRHDILVLLVDHDEFRNIQIPKDKIIIDTKGIWL